MRNNSKCVLLAQRSRLSISRSSSESKAFRLNYTASPADCSFSLAENCSRSSISCFSLILPWIMPLCILPIIIFYNYSAFSGFTAAMFARRTLASFSRTYCITAALYSLIISYFWAAACCCCMALLSCAWSIPAAWSICFCFQNILKS